MRQDLVYLRLLFWLKARLLWRTYTRNVSAVLGVLGIIFAMGPMSLLVAFGLGVGFHFLEVPMRAHLLRAAMVGAYLLWLLSPLMGYAITEDFDFSKLLLFPISARQMLLGAIASSVLDFGLLLLAPMLLVVVISFSSGWLGFLLVLFTLGLFLFHTLALSQALGFAGAGLLRSRRGREATMVAFMVCVIGLYAAMQTGAGSLEHVNWRHFTNLAAWKALGYAPPGLTASALAAIGQGHYVAALGLLVPLLALCAGSLYLAAWLVQLVHAGEVISPPLRTRRAPAPTAKPTRGADPRASGRLFGLRLPPAVHAVAEKELKLLGREPIFRFTLLQVAYMLVIGGLMVRQWASLEGDVSVVSSAIGMWLAAGLVFMMESSILANIFGIEGNAAASLFLFPASRRQILLGKNLTYFAAFAVVNVLAGMVIGIAAGAPEMGLRLVVWMELALVGYVAVGNLASILFPYRLALRGWRVRPQSASQSMVYGLTYSLGALVASLVLLPVLAAVAVPTYFVGSAWLALTLPLAAAYVAGLYLLSLGLSEQLLLSREMELAQRLSETE